MVSESINHHRELFYYSFRGDTYSYLYYYHKKHPKIYMKSNGRVSEIELLPKKDCNDTVQRSSNYLNLKCKVMGKEGIKGTVIIVEDDLILSMVAERVVETLGFKVVAKATSGEQAIEKIKEHQPDVLLMDIFLEGNIDGIETVSRIRSFSNVPVIYISGNSDKHHIARAKKTGYVDFLSKPISQSKIILPLEKAIQIGREYDINQVHLI